MIYIASDHGGYVLKKYLKEVLKTEKFKVQDLGPNKYVATDDYPDFAEKVAEQVSLNPKENLGILLCKSGQGMAIVANKFKGVRAVVVWNMIEAIKSRKDNLANVLCLPAEFISPEIAGLVTVKWLETSPGEEERHLRRVEKISTLENKIWP